MEDSKFDESDVSDEISRQLAEIDIDANSELETPEDVTTSLEVSPIDLKLLHNLEHRLSSQRKAFEKQLKDCSDLLDSAADKIASCKKVDLSALKTEYANENENEEQFRTRILEAIAAEDEADESDRNTSFNDDEVPGLQSVNTSQESHRVADEVSINTCAASPVANEASQALVVYDENSLAVLEEAAASRVSKLKRRQAITLKKQEINHQKYDNAIKSRDENNMNKRQQRLNATKLEEEKNQALSFQREENLRIELNKKEAAMSDIAKSFENQIYELEKQTQAEQLRLKEEINKLNEQREKKKIQSAVKIQSIYRGYRVRMSFGEEVKSRIAEHMQATEEKLIQEAEKRIKLVEEQKQKEEALRLAEIKLLKEKQAKEEEELRLKREKEIEEAKLKEMKAKEEERAKKLEKQRKKDEKERLKAEKEAKVQAEKKAEAEAKLKAEAEAKLKAEAEAKLKAEAEAKLKAEAEAKLKAETEAKLKAEAEAKLKAEAKMKLEQKAKAELPSSNTLKISRDAPLKSNAGYLKDEIRSSFAEMQHQMPSEVQYVNNTKRLLQEEQSVNFNDGHGTVHADGKGQESSKKQPANKEMSINFSKEASANGKKFSGEEVAPIADAHSSKALNKSNKHQTTKEEILNQQTNTKPNNSVQSKSKDFISKAPKLFASNGVLKNSSIGAVDLSYLSSKIEERRKRWIEECTPWSKISSEARNTISKVRKRLKRPPSAAKKQSPISEDLLLSQSEKDSLSQVEAVQLKDLPGCTLSTLGPCKKLRALSLKSSGVCTVDHLDAATHLLYADLKMNAIDSVNLHSSTLVYLNLSSNYLNAIRGFESCINLRYLNLSHNKISKMSNLGSLKTLHTLDLSHNALINTKGLGECVTLQVVDISHNHLTSIDELRNLCLLRKLTATANNLMEIPRLTNCVLLESLSLDDNSISSLNGLAFFWLPCLHTVNLSQNGISAIQVLHGCYSLSSLDLGHNQLVDLGNLLDGLKFCVNLEYLVLEGNPIISKDTNKAQLSSTLPQLKYLDGQELFSHHPIEFSSEILSMCSKSRSEFSSLEKTYQPIISNHLSQFPMSNEELLKRVNQLQLYYHSAFTLAENLRYAHEYGSMTFEPFQEPKYAATSKELFEAKVADATKMPHKDEARQLSEKDIFEQKLRATLESTELKVSTENMKMIKSIPSPRPHSRLRQSFANNKVKSSLEDSAVINGDRKSVDTTKSQSFLHHSNAFSNSHINMLETKSDHSLGEILPGKPADTFSSNAIVSHVGNHVGNGELNGSIFQLDAAATKIQALWRGHSLRQRLMKAVEFANRPSSVDSDDEMPEIDLSTFDFDVDEDEWRPPDTPTLPQKHAVLPSKPYNVDRVDNTSNQLFDTQHRVAWRESPSSMMESSRNVVPCLSSMSGEISHRSKKEELIAEDWGFKDSHTAELMMKRAKKLKYNAQRKKKLNQLDAVSRYEFQQKVSHNAEAPKVLAPVRKAAPRVEYFKALEEETRKKKSTNAAEKEVAAERTYEWIHTQVGSTEIEHSERQGSGGHQLPYMDKRLLDGGRTQLVGSPLEIMSVDSYGGASSAGSHRRVSQPSSQFSNPSAHNSYRSKNPAIDAQGSSRSMKDSLHSKHTKSDNFNAWGTGKKRTKK